MFKYANTNCPYCNRPLTESDELAVCPECGTPHHRACYLAHKQCANESLHAEGFEWKPAGYSDEPTAEFPSVTAEKAVCLNCGAVNRADVHYCNQCGAPMGYLRSAQEEPAQEPGAAAGFAALPYELEKEIRENKKLDGFSIRDWLSYIATNAGYYLYCFKVQDNSGRKQAFTWSAMLFPTIYFLYRRVWGAAAVSFVLQLILRVPTVVTAFVPLQNGTVLGLPYSAWQNAVTIFWGLSLLINFCWGLYAVYLYRRSAVRRMTALRARCSSDLEFSARVRQEGGPRWVYCLLPLIPAALATALLFMFVSLRMF